MKTEGVPEVLRKFQALSVQAQRSVVRDSLRSAARVVVRDAKDRVPVRTGRLKKNIIHTVSLQGAKGEALVGYRKEVFYGGFVEQGTSKMAARPYLRPALDNNEKAIGDTFIDALNRTIEGQTQRAAAVSRFIADVEAASG